MIKLVAIDIDGTLVNEQKILTDKVRDAIRQAIDQDVKIVLCTGRPFAGIRPYIEQLAFKKEEEYVISHNGAAITRLDSMEVVDQQPLRHEEIVELVQAAKGYPAEILLLNEEKFYVVARNGDEISQGVLDEGKLVQMDVELIPIDQLPADEQMLKMLFYGSANEVDVVEQALPPVFRERFYIVRSQPNLLEIMAKGTNKGTALKKLAGQLGLSMDEVMAIGDGDNDYEMIEAAGLGIVMENGTDHLKGIAHGITLSNEDDGVAHAFEKWVFKK